MHIQIAPVKPAAPRPRIHDLLAHAPMFRDLSADELARIAAGTREVRADRGQILFQRGDPCVGFHIVVFGQVKLTVGTPAGAEKVVDILGPGASFGEALMFTERPYVVAAATLADSLLLHVGMDTLFDEIARDPKLARRMLAGLSVRLHMLVRDVEALTVHSATQRVIGYLARLQDEAGLGRVTLPAQKSLVASRLNLTPEYFSRILHELEDDGIIAIDGRDIEIRDAQRLAEFGSETAQG
jgi:CRP-like cAMP-binding protein